MNKITMCGYRCDLCKAYAPNIETNDEREMLSKVWKKYYDLDIKAEQIYCDGCRCCKEDAVRIDSNCPVRQCVLQMGIDNCGDCGSFPCETFGERKGLSLEEAKEKLMADFDLEEYNNYLAAYDNLGRLQKQINIRILDEGQIASIVEATQGTNVRRKEDYLRMCIEENINNKRVTFIAYIGGDFAGLVNVVFESLYPYFRANDIPEINDLMVIPRFRRQGVAKKLMDEAEAYAAQRYTHIGLGVGLYKDFGPAQRLYMKYGYVPDGNGLMYNNEPVIPGSSVRVDNDLLIYLYKQLRD